MSLKTLFIRWYKVTPTRWRKREDCWFTIAGIITGSTLASTYRWVAFIGLGLMIASKLANLAVEDNSTDADTPKS